MILFFFATMTGEQNGDVFHNCFRDLFPTVSRVYAVVSLFPHVTG